MIQIDARAKVYDETVTVVGYKIREKCFVYRRDGHKENYFAADILMSERGKKIFVLVAVMNYVFLFSFWLLGIIWLATHMALLYHYSVPANGLDFFVVAVLVWVIIKFIKMKGYWW